MRTHFRLKESSVQTNVDEGILEGFVHSINGKDCEVYLGVPYASPPIGDLRFKKPEPHPGWDGVKKCKRFASRSIQKDMFWDKVVIPLQQSEDCLYLNVFAPKRGDGKTYPVLFYIHGGGFMMDSAAKYAYKDVCEQITSKDCVLVTIQYRLGYLGFFSLGSNSCKGNYGLWDQLMALQWTKKNISSFGGDPDKITVAGQSAGAVSTDLLSLSPLSRDLFHQKITMGGNSFCHWAVSDQQEIDDFCRKKARRLGWKPKKKYFATQEEEDEAMMNYLRKVPAHKFACHMIGTKEVFNEARLPLCPVIDGEILPRPLSILREESTPKPSIGGVGEYESLLFVALGFIRCNGKFLDMMMSMVSKRAKGKDALKDIQESVRDIYGDWRGKSRKELARICVLFLSDLISNYASHQYMKDAQRHGLPTYVYSLDFTSRNMWGFLKAVIPFCERRGTHASELLYLFKCNYFVAALPMDSNDKIVADIMPRLITNFVKYGNPNAADTRELGVQWDPIQKDHKPMLSISPQTHMKSVAFEGRMERLNELFIKYNLDYRYHISQR